MHLNMPPMSSVTPINVITYNTVYSFVTTVVYRLEHTIVISVDNLH